MKDIYVDLDKTFGGKEFTLTSIESNFQFIQNKKSDNQIGWKLIAVIPTMGFEKVAIKIDDKNYDVSELESKLKTAKNHFINVTFENLEGRVYNFNNKMGISMKATGCKVVA